MSEEFIFGSKPSPEYIEMVREDDSEPEMDYIKTLYNNMLELQENILHGFVSSLNKEDA